MSKYEEQQKPEKLQNFSPRSFLLRRHFSDDIFYDDLKYLIKSDWGSDKKHFLDKIKGGKFSALLSG